MILQDEFSGSIIGGIIGSIIATIGSVLVWVIIEILKKSREKKKLKKNIRLLYKEFAKETLEPYMSINIKELIREIGTQNFLKLLKFDGEFVGDAILFSSEIFMIELHYKKGENRVGLIEKKDLEKRFYYNEPNTFAEIREKFLEYFRSQCENSGIKIKIK
ncbi:hypothetical protein LCGC14_2246930 [marine sediment metagenome]|uniref:Uncharacterized protein n=1 Tax=marine sediment metagenome TaxID=412755 RepID=A0A0F9DRA7_9ZZZZ